MGGRQRPATPWGSLHRPAEGRWPNLLLIHLPVHASWLNQVESYFSVVQRKAVPPTDFPNLAEVKARLLAFQDHYEQIAAPFQWKFTTADLHALLVDRADPSTDLPSPPDPTPGIRHRDSVPDHQD